MIANSKRAKTSHSYQRKHTKPARIPRFYYQVDDMVHFVEDMNNELHTQTALEKGQAMSNNYSYFELQKGCESSLVGILQY
jgi:hypothetical protein